MFMGSTMTEILQRIENYFSSSGSKTWRSSATTCMVCARRILTSSWTPIKPIVGHSTTTAVI